jgi:hypothetical protein
MTSQILRLSALLWVVTFAFALILYLPAVDLRKDFVSWSSVQKQPDSVLQIGSWEAVDEDPFSVRIFSRGEAEIEKRSETDGGGVCENNTECGGIDQGECVSERCVCDEAYHGPFCQNERKSKLTAFLLQLLVGPIFGLPPGAGRIYLGYTASGIGEIILGLAWLLLVVPLIVHLLLSIFCCGTGSACAANSDNQCFGLIGCLGAGGVCGGGNLMITIFIIFLQIGTSLAALSWWLYDWISILTGGLIEKGGIELINDM